MHIDFSPTCWRLYRLYTCQRIYVPGASWNPWSPSVVACHLYEYTLCLCSIVLQSVWSLPPPVCPRHVGAPTGQCPHLYCAFPRVWISLVQEGQELCQMRYLGWVDIRKTAVDTTPQMVFLSQPSQFSRAGHWLGVLLVIRSMTQLIPMAWFINWPEMLIN